MGEVFFTTSWDDGHPLDLRLAELLEKHGFRGTFYVPCRNREGLPVLDGGQLRELANKGFEIGSHTLDHCFLDTVDAAEAKRQIVDGKRWVEDELGTSVAGFCYPGGRFTEHHARMVRDAGFKYARTVVNLQRLVPTDPFCVSTTLQLYPHGRWTFLKNYAKSGQWRKRAHLFAVVMVHRDLKSRLEATLDHICGTGGVFHLWGHSWEIERFSGWALLDDFLRLSADRIPKDSRLDNGSLLEWPTSTLPRVIKHGHV